MSAAALYVNEGRWPARVHVEGCRYLRVSLEWPHDPGNAQNDPEAIDANGVDRTGWSGSHSRPTTVDELRPSWRDCGACGGAGR